MSGLGFLQLPCLTFIPFEVSRNQFSAKSLLKVRNGGFAQLKCAKRTTIRAEVHKDNKKGVDGQLELPELTIQDIPYVDEVVKRLSRNRDAFEKIESDVVYLDEAYERCRKICAEHDKLLITVLQQLTKEQQQAIWAIYAWGRRIDELVDSPDDDDYTHSAQLDQWEERTKDILNGRPHDIHDAALVDTLSKFPIDTALFQDLLKGMRMDTAKNRYSNFEELFLYSYYVAGTVSLMLVQVTGIAPESTVSTNTIHDGMVYFGLATQLTNILRDVSHDAQSGRVYLPQDELAQFGVCNEDIFSRKVTDGWRELMKMQIQRARFYYKLAEQGVSQLDKAISSKLLAGMMVYSHMLDEIEENDYDNLTNSVGKRKF